MPSRDTRPEPADPQLSHPGRQKITVLYFFRREHDNQRKNKAVLEPTCPNTGEGEEPVVMAAGVKADRCRSCADGTLSEGFWLADEDVGHASHPSLSD